MKKHIQFFLKTMTVFIFLFQGNAMGQQSCGSDCDCAAVDCGDMMGPACCSQGVCGCCDGPVKGECCDGACCYK